MLPLALNNGFQLSLERFEKRVRVIVTNDNAEFVCRKESFKNLETFLQSGKSHIFKGRLQLYKDINDVHVKAKGETLGKIPAVQLEKYLSALKASG